MGERYSRLFSLPANLYAENAPIVIAAGALLRDNQSGKVLVQLKIKNISKTSIKASKVKITSFDVFGNRLGEDIEHIYLDLKAKRDDEFGQRIPIVLSDASVRSFTVRVTEILFEDNSIWNCNNEEWKPLIVPDTLEQILAHDNRLVEQYRLEYGAGCKYGLTVDRDLWICSCGCINKNSEADCHGCRCSKETLEKFDVNKLKKDKSARLACELEKAPEKKANTKALAKRGLIVFVIVSLVVTVLLAVIDFTKNISLYNKAIELCQSGNYGEAVELFESLDDFKDSTERLVEAKYQKAINDLKEGSYTAAAELFEEISQYKDSKVKAEEAIEKAVIADFITQPRSGSYVDTAEIFGDSVKGRKTLTEKEIKSIIVNLWIEDGSDTAIADFKKDGTIKKEIYGSNGFHRVVNKFEWKTKKDMLQITKHFDNGTVLEKEYIVIKLTDEILLLAHPKSKIIKEVLIEEGCNWAEVYLKSKGLYRD